MYLIFAVIFTFLSNFALFPIDLKSVTYYLTSPITSIQVVHQRNKSQRIAVILGNSDFDCIFGINNQTLVTKIGLPFLDGRTHAPRSKQRRHSQQTTFIHQMIKKSPIFSLVSKVRKKELAAVELVDPNVVQPSSLARCQMNRETFCASIAFQSLRKKNPSSAIS